jgi:hypothetical protein
MQVRRSASGTKLRCFRVNPCEDRHLFRLERGGAPWPHPRPVACAKRPTPRNLLPSELHVPLALGRYSFCHSLFCGRRCLGLFFIALKDVFDAFWDNLLVVRDMLLSDIFFTQ